MDVSEQYSHVWKYHLKQAINNMSSHICDLPEEKQIQVINEMKKIADEIAALSKEAWIEQ